jgi:hypothetical protein
MNGLKPLLKIMGAGVAAFAALNLFCLIYDRLPVHITSKTGATDYVWEKHFYYSTMTEGFGYGRMNNEGFNNLADYHSGDAVEVLLMGSSHTEAVQIPQEKTNAALLNKHFGGKKHLYNIGISGHDFIHISNNLETAVRCYGPKEYVVIETGSIQFNIHSLEDIINGRVQRIPSYDSPVMFYLQKLPYLRRLYHQLKGVKGQIEKEEASLVPDLDMSEEYREILSTVVQRLYAICAASGVKPLIFYHPHLRLNKDGSASPETDAAYLAAFRAACEANNVAFLDMTAAFLETYQNERVLPYGFANTACGAGHLNKHGHRLIARELYRFITQGGSA